MLKVGKKGRGQGQRSVSTLPLKMLYVGANLGKNWVKIGDNLIGY